MALKELYKPKSIEGVTIDKSVKDFISKGGGTVEQPEVSGDHRLTLRIPKWLLEKIDVKRSERIGKISRNLWILETLEKATK